VDQEAPRVKTLISNLKLNVAAGALKQSQGMSKEREALSALDKVCRACVCVSVVCPRRHTHTHLFVDVCVCVSVSVCVCVCVDVCVCTHTHVYVGDTTCKRSPSDYS
jgi:hypothetical protein